MTSPETKTQAGALVQPGTGTVMLWADGPGTVAYLLALAPDVARTLAAELDSAATLAHPITREGSDE